MRAAEGWAAHAAWHGCERSAGCPAASWRCCAGCAGRRQPKGAATVEPAGKLPMATLLTPAAERIHLVWQGVLGAEPSGPPQLPAHHRAAEVGPAGKMCQHSRRAPVRMTVLGRLLQRVGCFRRGADAAVAQQAGSNHGCKWLSSAQCCCAGRSRTGCRPSESTAALAPAAAQPSCSRHMPCHTLARAFAFRCVPAFFPKHACICDSKPLSRVLCLYQMEVLATSFGMAHCAAGRPCALTRRADRAAAQHAARWQQQSGAKTPVTLPLLTLRSYAISASSALPSVTGGGISGRPSGSLYQQLEITKREKEEAGEKQQSWKRRSCETVKQT